MDMEMSEKLKALEEQVAVIKDKELRRVAFEKLLEAALPTRTVVAPPKEPDGQEKIKNEEADLSTFFSQIDHEKPADNALALAAYYYSQYGAVDFTLGEINSLSRDVGVTIPERVDMTYAAAQRDGKNLFRRSGRGAFRPTVYGEAYFKRTYQVSKGRKEKHSEE